MKGKIVFLGLSAISLIVLVFMAIFLWYLMAPRLAQIHIGFPLLVGFAMALFALLVSLGLVLILVSTATERNLLFPGENQLTVKVLFPIAVVVGRVFGISKEAVKRSFIQVNNALVRALKKGRIDSRRLLLLLPHCLQNYACIYKITSTMENCRRCGQCVVVTQNWVSRARNNWNANLKGYLPGQHLVAHPSNFVNCWPNKDQAILGAPFR